MTVSYNNYLSVKNKYCVGYFGVFNEFVLQLIHLLPVIEKQLPGIDLYIAGKNEISTVIQHPKLVLEKNLNKKSYAFYRELKFDNIDHPVEAFIEESGLNITVKKEIVVPVSKKCVLITSNLPPVKSLDKSKIEKIKSFAMREGFDVEENGNLDEAGWVIGVESEKLCLAAMKGIKTSLVPSGLGTSLLEKMFKNLERLESI